MTQASQKRNKLATFGRLQLEALEGREVPAVDLLSIANSDFPTNKPLFVPVTVNQANGPVTYSITSSNPSVTAEVVTGGRSVELTVSGKDSGNTPFSGTITFRLFESSAPLSTANIVTLVNAGYYNGKIFHRVINDFVIQGGSPAGDGQGGSSLVPTVRDEFNTQYTFASRGIVAIANSGNDTNNSQFFITDPFIVSSGVETPAPLDRRSQFLNFNYSIIGIVTDGFDLYQQIMNVPKVLGNDNAISSPVNPVTITSAKVLTTNLDGVVKLTATGGFLGTSNIQVTATQGATQQSKSFTVTSVADTVNDPPFLSPVAAQLTKVNTAVSFTVPFTEIDPGDSDVFQVGRLVATANGPVFTTLDPLQGTASVDATGKVTFTPAAGFIGTVQLTVGVRDATDRVGSALGLNDARNSDTDVISVTVQTVANPTISNLPNQLSSGAAVGPVAFTVGDADSAATSLTVTAKSSNTVLLPAGSITLGGTDANRTITLTPAAGQKGFAVVTVTVTDIDGATSSDTFTLNVPSSTGTSPRLVGDREFAVGSDAGGGAAQLDNADGSVRFSVAPFEADFRGGIRAAAADFTGDGVADLAVASGPGRAGAVRIYDGVSTVVLFDFVPFGSEFTAGIVISAGDITGDGKAELVITAESGGGARVRVISRDTGVFTQTTDFIGLIGGDGVADTSFRGGARAAVGDVNGDGFGDLIFAAGAGGGPRVAIFNGKMLTLTGGPKLSGDFFAFEPELRNGTYVAAGDFNGDGLADIVAGAGPGGGPRVTIYDGADMLNNKLTKFKDFFAGSLTTRGGIRVTVKNLDNDSKADLVVGAGPGGSHATAYTATQLALSNSQSAFDYEPYPGFNGGLFVG